MVSKEKEAAENAGGAQAVKAEDVARQRILARQMPLGFVHDSLTKNLEGRKLMRDFTIYVPFVLMFVWFFLARRDIESEYYTANSIKDLLFGEELQPTNPLTPNNWNTNPYFNKGFADIGNYGDIYDYIESVLITQMFVDPPGNAKNTLRLTGQNVPLGSLRIRAKHVRSDSCDVNKYVYPPTVPQSCFGDYSPENELKQTNNTATFIPFNYTEGCGEKPLQDLYGIHTTYPCGGFIVDIPFTTPVQEALQIIGSLRTKDFANIVSLRLFAIEMVAYNPAVDVFLNMKMFVEVTTQGGFLPQARFRPFKVFDNEEWGWMLYSFIFLIFVLYYWYAFFSQWRRSYRMTKKVLPYILQVWSIFDLMKQVSFTLMFIFHFYWWSLSSDIDWKFPHSDAYPMDLAGIAEVWQMQVYFNALCTVIVFLSIMKFLRLNNRLNILTRTLETVAQSILGVLVIFVLQVGGYAIAGHFIFGGSMYQYRHTNEAFASTFRLLIGQFDYEAMKQEQRSLSFIYFWSFVFLGLFVLLNFVVAVVMNGFDTENGKIKPIPFALAVKRAWRNFMNSVTSEGFCQQVAAAILSRARRLPEDTLHEYVGTHLTTIRMGLEATAAEQGDEEQVAGAGDDVSLQRVVWEEPFSRGDFLKIMPRSELEDIGDDYVDNLWIQIFTEFEETVVDESEERIQDLCDIVFGASNDAVCHVLLAHKRALFGENSLIRAEEERKRREAEAKRSLLDRAASGVTSFF